MENIITSLKYVFGPIPSRRLGMSLGVDLVPSKICNYDCVFCEIGPTKKTVTVRKEYVKKEVIVSELEKFISSYHGRIDHITLTGSGETTLNSKLGEIISEIKAKFSYPVAVLTHSGNIDDQKVREELALADVVCPSLDAVSQEIFEKVNKANPSIKIQNVINGLFEFRNLYKGKIFLEVLLVKGINDSDDEIEKIAKVCKDLKPDRVHINTVDRPGAYPEAIPLSGEDLSRVKSIFLKYIDNIDVLSRHYDNFEPPKYSSTEEMKKDIFTMLKRRPMTILDIVVITGASYFDIHNSLETLKVENLVEEVRLNGNVFYKIKTKNLL